MFDLATLQGALVASVQALEDEALFGHEVMANMAKACVEGGAKGIRANSVIDINAIKKVVNVPVIGIIKQEYPDSEVYITPTKKEVEALLTTDCEIIALDATNRTRPNKESLASLLALIHKHNRLAMADISTFEEALVAQKLGFDLVSTTLSGYTDYSKKLESPDYKLIKRCHKAGMKIVAEGRIHTFTHMKKVQKCKPYFTVVGGAITRPKEITERFVQELWNKNQ